LHSPKRASVTGGYEMMEGFLSQTLKHERQTRLVLSFKV